MKLTQEQALGCEVGLYWSDGHGAQDEGERRLYVRIINARVPFEHHYLAPPELVEMHKAAIARAVQDGRVELEP